MINQGHCFHCGLVIKGEIFYVEIAGGRQPMCCVGCQAVAAAIVEHGLESFYEYRERDSQSQLNIIIPNQLQYEQYNQVDIQQPFLIQSEEAINDQKEIRVSIEGLTCAACVWLFEKHISSLAGVVNCTVNMSSHRAQIKWHDNVTSLSQILYQVSKLGFRAYPYRVQEQEVYQQNEQQKTLKRLAISGLGFGQVMMFSAPLYDWFSYPMPANYRDFFRIVSLIVTTPVLLYCGWPYFHSGVKSIRSRLLSMDVSISLALLVVFIAGVYATFKRNGEVYFDSITMFLFFITLSRFLEMRARHYSNRVVQSLLKHQPEWVIRVRDGVSESIAISRLKVSDDIIVKAGETIPVDGRVRVGESSVSEALLTGEVVPKLKRQQDVVYAGSQNIDQPLQIIVDKLGEQTALATIVKLYEQAHFTKPKMITFTQKTAHYFVIIQIVLSVILFAYWLPFSTEKAFWVMISLLVITCPCALAIATPIAVTSSMHALCRKGVLCSNSDIFESFFKITDYIFDKTGTLTEGVFSIHSITNNSDMSDHQLMLVASALELHSEHPIATAFRHIIPDCQVADVKITPNHGIEGMVNGVYYYLGKPEFIECKTSIHHLMPDPTTIYTPILLATQDAVLADFYLVDQLRPGVVETLNTLAKKGYSLHILSGDHHDCVEYYAKKLNITHYESHCSPLDKLNYVTRLQQAGKAVAVMGDGLNDAPVLKQADISIAMTTAADLTRISADVILLKADMTLLILMGDHVKKTMLIIKQCLLWAILYNIISIPFAVTGLVAPYVAASLMSISSIVVVMNALRLTKIKLKLVDKHQFYYPNIQLKEC